MRSGRSRSLLKMVNPRLGRPSFESWPLRWKQVGYVVLRSVAVCVSCAVTLPWLLWLLSRLLFCGSWR